VIGNIIEFLRGLVFSLDAGFSLTADCMTFITVS